MSRVFALSVHAAYRCAHSGACCTAGWAIPVEPPKQAALGAAVLVPDRHGACRFFDGTARLCSVHRDSGESAKPDSCRHFPRVALVDGRGTHVTLSHFCPTAARLLLDPTIPLEIVESPPAFPDDDTYEGLDARGEWPPLVHRTLLFDLDAYGAWERFVVTTLATAHESEPALARIAGVGEALRRWTPGDGPMAALVRRLADSADANLALLSRYESIRASAREIVMDAIPEELRPSAQRPAPGTEHHAFGTQHAAPACRFLAAKAFGSWTAYQGRGVRTLVAELVLADAVVRDLASDRPLVEAIREADRRLVHLVDRRALVARLGSIEFG